MLGFILSQRANIYINRILTSCTNVLNVVKHATGRMLNMEKR